MISFIFGIIITFAVIFLVPFIFYGTFAALKIIDELEEENVKDFILNVTFTKLSTSILFVLLFYSINLYIGDFWLVFGLIWAITSAIGELGDTFKADYTYKEALIGIMSEFIYFPLSGFFLSLIF